MPFSTRRGYERKEKRGDREGKGMGRKRREEKGSAQLQDA